MKIKQLFMVAVVTVFAVATYFDSQRIPGLVVNAQGQVNGITSVDWSPDGSQYAAAYFDTTVKIYDSGSNALVHTLGGHPSVVVTLDWNPNPSIPLLASSSENLIFIWNVETGVLVETLEGHDDDISSIAWSPDGSKLATGSIKERYNLRIWNASDWQSRAYIVPSLYAITWRPDGERLAIASIGTFVDIWDFSTIETPETFTHVEKIENHTTSVLSASWSPNGQFLASGSMDGSINIRNINTGANFPIEHNSLQSHDWVWSVRWSPDNKRVASVGTDGFVRVWDARTGYLLQTISANGNVLFTVAWSPDGNKLVYGGERNTLVIVSIPPLFPHDLLIQQMSSSSVQLNWADDSNETQFRVERSTTGMSDWLEISTSVADATTYTDSTVNPSTTYYYRVRAYRSSDDQYSEYSNVASILTASAAPSDLGVVAGPSGRTYLSWQDNSSDETFFNVERSPDGTTWEEIGAVQTDVVSLEDAGLEPSTIYWYRVRAHRDGDNQYSDYTQSVSVLTAPADPSQIAATLSAPNQIQINWIDNSTDETEFRVERSTTGTNNWSEIGTATATTYTDSTANPSTTYYYRVQAYRSSDNVFSDYSAASSGILSSPATSAGFAGVPLPINKAKLTWTDSSTDETNFRLERSDNGTSGWSEIATIPANQTTYTETRTNCIQTSYYRIRAYRSSDNQYSAYSPVVSVTTDGCGPDRLALFNTIHTHNRRFTDFPGTSYTDYWLNSPVAAGRWVMGDWNGDGVDTPAVFNQDANSFAFTNDTGATGTWVSMTLTLDGVPVAGRFNANHTNDCLGVVDDIPFGSDTAFALWFVCDYTNLTPNIAELGYQWLGTPLANSAGYSSYGIHQFVTGDFNTDGVDTVAVRRGTIIVYGNTPPTSQIAAIDLAQYFGNPYNGQYSGLYGILVAGDWNYDGVDTFGYFYEDGNFYWRNHLDWNQPTSGSALIPHLYGIYVLPTTWRN